MWQLVRNDWRATKWLVPIFLIFIPLTYQINITSLGIFLWIWLSSLLSVFATEKNNNVLMFYCSLPIQKKAIVQARYVYFLSLTILTLLYLLLVDLVAHLYMPNKFIPPIHITEIIDLFWLTSFFFAVYIPVFYFFRQFNHALVFFFISFALFVYVNAVIGGNPYITFDKPVREFFYELFSTHPYTVPIGLSVCCLFISYVISVQLIKRRDIV